MSLKIITIKMLSTNNLQFFKHLKLNNFQLKASKIDWLNLKCLEICNMKLGAVKNMYLKFKIQDFVTDSKWIFKNWKIQISKP